MLVDLRSAGLRSTDIDAVLQVTFQQGNKIGFGNQVSLSLFFSYFDVGLMWKKMTIVHDTIHYSITLTGL